MQYEPETLEMLEMAKSLSSVSGGDFDKLTPMQRLFAAQYVVTGGNGAEAAELAGYAHPKQAGLKLRLNPTVAALIQLLALADARSTLPVAIAVLLDIATGFDQVEGGPKVYRANPTERRKAALDLARLGGALQQQHGPTVAVQVNQGGASADGSPSSASVVIQNVWSSRAARLSGIAAPMLDTSTTIDGDANADSEWPG